MNITRYKRKPDNLCDCVIEAAGPTPPQSHFFRLIQINDALHAMRERPGNFLKALITYENCAG